MFRITLKNEKLASYNNLDLLILFIHLLYFCGYFIKTTSGVNYIGLAAGIGVAFFGIALNIKCARKNIQPFIPFWLIFFLLSIVWIMMRFYWLCPAMILLAVLELFIRKTPTVIFHDDRIELKAFPNRTFAWNDMNNVILKDGILTLDFKTDKLIQAEVGEESGSVNEGEFNEYCSRFL
ncbi:MAG TPA: hypothetical protein VKH37_09610 [Ferruginibacter sp.]|nr:hypothetical protein [Ferruginibacter sp.]